MARDDMGSRIFGLPLGMALGLVGLIMTVAILGLIWKEQLDALGRGGDELGVDASGGPMRILDSTRVTATIVKMREIGGALEGFRAEHGGYPADLKAANPRSGSPADRWGAPMEYSAGGASAGRALFTSYELVSRGADGLRGTGDDLVMRNGIVEVSMDGGPGDGGSSGASASSASSPGRSEEPAPSSPGSRALDAARGIAAGGGHKDESGGE